MRTLNSFPDDHLFPRLPDALDAEKMMNLFRRELAGNSEKGRYRLAGCVPEYVRYKPGVSCVIGYCLYVSENNNPSQKIQRVHGRFLTPGNGEEEYRKARKTHTATPLWGPPVAYFPELEMIVSFFPNDRSLRGLRFVLDPDKLKRMAQSRLRERVKEPWWIRGRRTRIDILSYKPERHCVIQCRLGMRNVDTGAKKEVRVIGKILRREEGKYIYDTNRKIWDLFNEIDEVPLVPDPLAFDPGFSFFFQEEIIGDHPFPDTYSRTEWHSILSQIAGRLKSFHELSLTDLRPYRHDDMYGELRMSIVNAADVLPGKKRVFLNIVGELEKGLSELNGCQQCPTHGDFHLGQILMRRDGPVILDLDSIRMSDPIMDVANFAAHLFKFELQGRLSCEEGDKAESVILKGYFEEKECQHVERA